MEQKTNTNKKPIIIAVVAALLVIAAVVVIVILVNKKEQTYRSILVYDVEGTVTITREKVGDLEAYENLQLQSGDSVTVEKDSSVRLKLDDDKYVMVEAESELNLVAEGDGANSKTTINLTKGAITNEIQNKLNGDSEYEVTTPNSIMAVRGTVFRVEVVLDEAGNSYTRLSTFDGTVGSKLIKPDGTIVEEEVLIKAGKEVRIVGTNEDSEYLTEPEDIDYSSLPVKALSFLREIIENGHSLSISLEELDKIIAIEKETEEPDYYIVTFTYNGAVFGSQQVSPGNKATAPLLTPSAKGKWNFDFTTEIHEDTTIKWE